MLTNFNTPKVDNIPKRVIICSILFATFVCTAFSIIILEIGDTPYFNFGPSDELTFFHIKINSWERWYVVICYIIISTLLASIVTEFVMPYIITQIQDTSKPNSAKGWQVQLLVQVYYISWSVQTIITTYVYFSQVDIVFTQMIVYNIVSFFTTRHYISIKNELDINREDFVLNDDDSLPLYYVL